MKSHETLPINPPAPLGVALHGVVRRQFPIMEGGARRAKDDLTSIPWDMIAHHDATARQNHGGQTLERLAQRGGLCPLEAVAVMEDADYRKRWPQMMHTRDEQEKLTLEARAILKQMVANWMPPNAEPSSGANNQ